ncbi:hypothetical protein MBLNU457_1590t1 [Dothideomycetes sp. NU457]
MFRTQITRQARLFSTQSRLQKSMMDTAKETLQNANKVVGETLAKGIDNTQNAAGANKGEMQGKMEEMAGQAKGSAKEMAGEASGKTSELQGKAKGMAEEAKQKMQ